MKLVFYSGFVILNLGRCEGKRIMTIKCMIGKHKIIEYYLYTFRLDVLPYTKQWPLAPPSLPYKVSCIRARS